MINVKLIEDYLDSQINEINTSVNNSGNSLLIVLAGFPPNVIGNLKIERLINNEYELDTFYSDRTEMKKVLSEIMVQNSKNMTFWLPIIDYLALDSTFIENLFDITFIKCPFYHYAIPIFDKLSQKNEPNSESFEDLSTEFSTPLSFNEDFHKFFDTKIGQIIRTKESDYILLAKDVFWKKVEEEFGKYTKEHSKDYIDYSITEDEGSWIRLIEKINYLDDSIGINISISNSLFDTWMLSLEHLDSFCFNHIRVNQEESFTQRNNYEFPKKLLRHYWQKQSFRSFKVYQNVRNGKPIQIVDETQENVINDIFTQVENANCGKPYKDIFVTAPTGTGKSVMFQIPAIQLHSMGKITLIISPLIALMNDQIRSLVDKTVNNAATINSSISILEKEEIISKVKTGEISILYLSPESLLSRSDISMLIGEREIGLLVVDEAHIVTTWGKAFRPDYWYLGNYIQRLRKERNFPIATFTATAIYSGMEDMFTETRDSLGMRDPISYFGYVPRKNISVSFQKSDKAGEAKNKEYNEVKFSVLASRLEEFLKIGKKVLVYFPFVSLINEFCIYLSTRVTTIKPEDYSCYYGGMKSIEKTLNFENYRGNISRIMLATKAFGMGIDIPDIEVVYHFAPTGNVCDYIQEIGRAARDDKTEGIAFFDYLKKDFSYVNRLHGISTLSPVQLIKVMRKIYAIGEQNNFKRNLLVRSDAFQLIFDEGNNREDKEFNDLDSKVKTALLIIEKDYNQKLGYSPVIARPRALFTYAWFRIHDENEIQIVNKLLGDYITKTDNIIQLDLKKLWEKKYPNLSFAKFKYEFYCDQRKFGFSSEKVLVPLIMISYKNSENKSISYSTTKLIDVIMDFCHQKMQSGKFFKKEELLYHLKDNLRINDPNLITILSDSIISFLSNWSRSTDSNNNGRFLVEREDLGYRITNTGYSDIRDYAEKVQISTDEMSIFVDQVPTNRSYIVKIFSILGLFEASQHLVFSVNGGENPEIFIRVNSYFTLRNECFNFEKYENRILENVRQRHKTSVKFLDYLFTNISNDSAKFWNSIQDYFLGILPEYSEDD